MEVTPEGPADRYRINDLILDRGSRRVTRSNEALKVNGLTFDFLLVLVKASPSMASYDDLAEGVWQGRPVTPETIAQRAKILRAALSDDAKDPRYFEMIRGQGYRLIADVEPLGERSRRKLPSRRLGLAAAAVMAVALGSLGIFLRGNPAMPSVAVMPFTDLSPLGDQQYLADGVAEELINYLADLEGLEVASRTESFAVADTADEPQAFGQNLAVSTILKGSVRKYRDQIRITVQLIDVASGYHLWSQTYDRELTDIFAIQDEIAAAVAGTLGVSLGVGNVNAFSGAGTTSVKAYEAFLKANRTPLFGQSAERVRLLERAVQLDPEYAAAWASLGLTIAATMWISPVEEAPALLARAFPILQKAIELGPDSSYAFTMLATVSYARFDWIRSEEYYRKAMEMLPDGEVFMHYSNLMMRSGRSMRSLRYFELASKAQRNPINLPTNFMAAVALGQFDLLGGGKTVWGDLWSPMDHVLIALNSGDTAELRSSLRNVPSTARGQYGLAQSVLRNFDSPADILSTIKSTYRDPDAQWPAKHADVAVLAAFFGDPEFALESISHEARLTPIRYGALWSPVMSEVRKLPGFKQLMTDVNLVEYWRTYGWPDHCRPIGNNDFECY